MEQQKTAPEKKGRSKVFIIVLVLLLLGGGTFGISKYIHGLHHEETDDAQIDGFISPVIPRISGYVTELRVQDNQYVKEGDTLMILDDRDLKIKLEQAETALQTANNNLLAARATTTVAHDNVATSQASVSTIDAQIAEAKITAWRTSQDYARYENLIKDHSVTQQQYEQALAAKQTAEKQLEVLEDQKNQASRQTSAVASQSTATASQIGINNAIIRQREVDVADAKLNLSYTVITAPENGLVSKVNVQLGQYLQAGQSFFSIVHDSDAWVVANFKETQLKKMRIGQAVTVSVDAFAGHEFEAKVSSFAPATGARFALLPPDNASGNFVKVVQRLPVKIEFSNPADSLVKKLRPGMNCVVDVHLD
jgi:membrane fusion protein (multidrug efflux system)